MARNENHLARGSRHALRGLGTDGVWVSFKTLAIEDTGIPNYRSVSRRPTPCAFTWSVSVG